QREAKVQAQRDAESKAKLAAETSLWESVKSSRKAADVQKYLNRYPNGQYAEPARQRMLEFESTRLEEAAKRQKEGEKKKSTIIVPATTSKLYLYCWYLKSAVTPNAGVIG